MKQPFLCRKAKSDERESIARFLDAHWGSQHPLVHREEFFQHYYMGAQGLQFVIAECDSGIAAVAGYILANKCSTPDIWVSIWCARRDTAGAGMELMAALPKLTKARVIACNNIRPKTLAAYRFLGYTAERLPHYYRLAQRSSFSVAQISSFCRLPVSSGTPLIPVINVSQLTDVPLCTDIFPYKDAWYLSRRYFFYPHQRYQVWRHGHRLLVTRTVFVQNSVVLRIVDYIGRPDEFHLLGNGIDQLMQQEGAEYADCYCAGISSSIMAQAGFCERTEQDQNIIPNYLSPLLRENTEYYYFTSQTHNFLMFKADGDQDRPNLSQ